MKTKYYHGYRYNRGGHGVYHAVRDDPVLQGCKYEEERRDLKKQYDANMISKAEYDDARVHFFADKKYQNTSPPVLIRMELKHGDLVVMHGADLQKYYEVCEHCLFKFCRAVVVSDSQFVLTESALGALRRQDALRLDGPTYPGRPRRRS